jgi:hypothetical protein
MLPDTGTHVATTLFERETRTRGDTMALFNIKKIAFGMFLAVVVVLAANSDINAQSRRELERERQRIERENARYRSNRQRSSGYGNDNRSVRGSQQQVGSATYATGYEQGLMAGRFDRRRGKYNQSNVYRDTGAYPNSGDPTSNDYVYRQAYLQGYNDGFNGRRNY